MNVLETLLGTKEFREKEDQYRREVYDKTGKIIPKRNGGLLGLLTNKNKYETHSNTLDTPGAGKD